MSELVSCLVYGVISLVVAILIPVGFLLFAIVIMFCLDVYSARESRKKKR